RIASERLGSPGDLDGIITQGIVQFQNRRRPAWPIDRPEAQHGRDWIGLQGRKESLGCLLAFGIAPAALLDAKERYAESLGAPRRHADRHVIVRELEFVEWFRRPHRRIAAKSDAHALLGHALFPR